MLLPSGVLGALKDTVMPEFSQHVTEDANDCQKGGAKDRYQLLMFRRQFFKRHEDTERGQNGHAKQQEYIAELEMPLARLEGELSIQCPPEAGKEKTEQDTRNGYIRVRFHSFGGAQRADLPRREHPLVLPRRGAAGPAGRPADPRVLPARLRECEAAPEERTA
jgi:hypothetical protein